MTTPSNALRELAGLNEPTLRHRNRTMRRLPRSHNRFWCGGCDANLVYASETCQVCGSRHLERMPMKLREIA